LSVGLGHDKEGEISVGPFEQVWLAIDLKERLYGLRDLFFAYPARMEACEPRKRKGLRAKGEGRT